MTMSEIFAGIGYIVISLGGGGILVFALSGWLGKIWAKRIIEKEVYAYKQELERLSKHLEKKNYVSKVRFDAEFDIYRNLSVNLSQYMEAIGSLANKYYEFKGYGDDLLTAYNDCLLKYSTTKRAIIANRPFILHDIYKGFDTVCEEYKKICLIYPLKNMNQLSIEQSRSIAEAMIPLMNNCDSIADKLFDDIRIYLSQLDVQN